jgi:tRNA A37 methylthiotransferase MiaB
MRDLVPGGEIARRSRVLHEIAETKKHEFYSNQKGRRLRVLFEERAASGHFMGFSDNYVKVGVVAEEDLSNRLGIVSVTDVAVRKDAARAPLLAVGALAEIEGGREPRRSPV